MANCLCINFLFLAQVSLIVYYSKARIETGYNEIIGIMVGNSILFMWSYTFLIVKSMIPVCKSTNQKMLSSFPLHIYMFMHFFTPMMSRLTLLFQFSIFIGSFICKILQDIMLNVPFILHIDTTMILILTISFLK